jgi:hypothetical protein
MALPLIIPPLVKALAVVGGATVVGLFVKEVRRVNKQLEGVRPTPAGEPVPHHELPTLRRDPVSGEWRVV